MATFTPYSSKSSFVSEKSHRSRKFLSEKIRELGFNFRKKPALSTSTKSILRFVDIKTEENRPSNFAIMFPNINLEPLIYYQPEITSGDILQNKNFYKIEKFQTKSGEPKEIQRISDIEVKSIKPSKKMKFRKKKRHSSIISRIEGILNRGKEPMPSRDPSEESIVQEGAFQATLIEKTVYDLPESILQKIFLYFNQQERNLVLSRVCKTWYYVLKDPMFWTELSFSGDKVPSETIIRLLKSYPTLKKFKLTSVPDALEVLQELCRCNHSLTHLGVRRCKIVNYDFARIILHIISCCTNLEVLDLKEMQFQSDRFYLELGRLKNLRSINLTGNKLLRSQDLITLSVNCRELRELKIIDLSLDKNDFRTTLKDDDLTFIISHLERNLRTLKIDMQHLGNISYQAILKCTRLECLVMKNCLHLSSEMFRQFPALTNLKKLKITRAINIKPEDFCHVFETEKLQNIEDLDINGCWQVGEFGLQAITRNLISLKSLSLKNCKSIKGTSLSSLSSCSELISLNIAHTKVETGYLPSLHQHAKNLRNLVIDANMLKKATLRQLKKLFPSLILQVSYSEFQKDEKLLNDL